MHNIVLPAEPKPHAQHTYSNFRTVRCKYFDIGSCKNGDKCTFAHGDEQLRAPQQNPSFQAQGPAPHAPTFGGYPPMAPHADHSAGQLTENNIIILQLHFIVQKLWEIYPTDTNVHYYLNNAVSLLNMGNIDVSADTLHKLLNNEELKEKNKEGHEKIVEDAKNYGQMLKANMKSPFGFFPPSGRDGDYYVPQPNNFTSGGKNGEHDDVFYNS